MARYSFNEKWLKNVSLSELKKTFKSDKVQLEKAIELRHKLRGGN
jgi:hypothetical protein